MKDIKNLEGAIGINNEKNDLDKDDEPLKAQYVEEDNDKEEEVVESVVFVEEDEADKDEYVSKGPIR